MFTLILICMVLFTILGTCAVCFYGLKAYFAIKDKELELQHPANRSVTREEFDILFKQVADLDEKIKPVLIMKANKEIFRR